MKMLKTEITPGTNSHISLIERNGSYFTAPFHFHPEVELVYVTESYGKRIIGDSIEPFEAGDMVFIGSNLPHVWLNDEIFYKGITHLQAKATVLYFNTNVLGPLFYDMSEAAKISEFLVKAERGLRIEGNTRKKLVVKLKQLARKKGIEKIIGLFEVFKIMIDSKDLSFIASDGYNVQAKDAETDRISRVHKYVGENFRNEISLSVIANVVNLTPQSFCRLFKKRTGKNFVEYLNEVRISRACGYLLNTDWSVSEIAYRCGYKTITNFNKSFKENTGLSPKLYREQPGEMRR